MITDTKNQGSCERTKKNKLLYCSNEELRTNLKMFTKRKRKNSTLFLSFNQTRLKIKFKTYVGIIKG